MQTCTATTKNYPTGNSMSRDSAEIKRALYERRVDPEAFRTTLKVCGSVNIREYLESPTPMSKVTHVYPTGRATVSDSSLVLDLMCKELILAGKNAAIFGLVEIWHALFHDTEASQSTLSLLDSVEYIAIRGFYSTKWGSTGYVSLDQQDDMHYWVLSKLRGGCRFLLEADLPLEETVVMWDKRLVGTLLRDLTQFPVAKVVHP